MIPNWAGIYVGIPYESKGTGPGFDCWTFYKYVFGIERGITIPDNNNDYINANDMESVHNYFKNSKDEWEEIKVPEVYCLIMMKIAGEPVHVGMCLDNEYMIHTLKGHAAAIEKYTGKKWKNRIEGFYKWPFM